VRVFCCRFAADRATLAATARFPIVRDRLGIAGFGNAIRAGVLL
jgi:hypothetical protein